MQNTEWAVSYVIAVKEAAPLVSDQLAVAECQYLTLFGPRFTSRSTRVRHVMTYACFLYTFHIPAQKDTLTVRLGLSISAG